MLIHKIEFHGLEKLQALFNRGDGILIAPNHSDHADSALMLMMGQKVNNPFYFMATHAIFMGVNRHILPRIGCFPVDREGTDNRALRKAQEILSEGKSPLVIFPEGEIYRLNDQITPLRDGLAAVATTAARKAAQLGKKVWIVPVGIKYRFTDTADPMPWMKQCLNGLEAKFNWREDLSMSLLDRIYRYATGMLSLKEIEYLGGVQTGSVPERVRYLREFALKNVETRIGMVRNKTRLQSVPERVKECRRLILEKLANPNCGETDKQQLKVELEHLFFVVQLYSYPGDYVLNRPTFERAWEILKKFQQDATLLDVDRARYQIPRRAEIFVGDPIDVNEMMSRGNKRSEESDTDPLEMRDEKESGNRSRKAMSSLTHHLEEKLQELLEKGGPGRPLPGVTLNC